MLERQWWSDVAAQLADGDSFRRVFAAAAPAGLAQAGGTLDEVAGGAAAAEPGAAGVALPVLRPPHPLVREPPAAELAGAEGPLLGLRHAHLAALPAGRSWPPALLFAAVAWRVGPQPQALLWCAVVAALLALALIDWDTTVLPDALTLPLLWAGLVAAALGWLPG